MNGYRRYRLLQAFIAAALVVLMAVSDWWSLSGQSTRNRLSRRLAVPFSSPTTPLEDISLRYFIYNETNITQEKPCRVRPLLAKRYGRDVAYEQAILKALQTHPLRTQDPDEADLFIVPTPIGKILVSRDLSYDDAFTALTSHPLFNNGHKHVLISAVHVTFSHAKKKTVPSLSKWYNRLSNVTVATGQDFIASQRAYAQGLLAGNDFEPVFSQMQPVAHHMFSIGLGEGSFDFEIHKATMEKFLNSTHFLFYRTRTSGSLFNSTRFRHAPVVNTTTSLGDNGLGRFNIGFDVSREEWLQGFVDAKYCLVIRGDTPHTHALIRSVRAGCLPVVISDVYPLYAPILKSTLDMHDYCIFIDEQTFIRNPQAELNKLQLLSVEEVQAKLEALKFAQRVILPDHPESLFVPAFLKETLMAMQDPVPVVG